MNYKDIPYDVAVPSSKLKILLWLITGGKKGELFIKEQKTVRQWFGPKDQINCRCVQVPLTKKGE